MSPVTAFLYGWQLRRFLIPTPHSDAADAQTLRRFFSRDPCTVKTVPVTAYPWHRLASRHARTTGLHRQTRATRHYSQIENGSRMRCNENGQ
jgi:hypothetical protein